MDVLVLGAALTVMAAILCAAMAIQEMSAGPRGSMERRLGSLLGESTGYEVSARDFDNLRQTRTGRVPIISSLLEGKNWTEEMGSRLERADLKLTVSEFVGMRFFVAAAAAVVPILMVPGFLGKLAALALGFIGYMIPGLWLGMATGKRVKKLENQLIEALTLCSNSLKAGFGLMQALDLAAKELPHPISTELRRCLYDINVGSTNEEALQAMAKRGGSKDLDIVITAMLIQQSTGGNLSEILDNVSHTMRERIRIRGEIKTLTTQQMLTGFIIGGLPFAMAAGFMVLSPDYMAPLWQNTAGFVMIAGAGMLELFGILAIKKILQIEV